MPACVVQVPAVRECAALVRLREHAVDVDEHAQPPIRAPQTRAILADLHRKPGDDVRAAPDRLQLGGGEIMA